MTDTAPAPKPIRQPTLAAPQAPVPDAVADAVTRLRYGVVQLTVHDGKVVQLDVTERQRFS